MVGLISFIPYRCAQSELDGPDVTMKVKLKDMN